MAIFVDVRVSIAGEGFPLEKVKVKLDLMLGRRATLIGFAETNATGVATFLVATPPQPPLFGFQSTTVRASVVDASENTVRSMTRTVRPGARNRIAVNLSVKDYLSSGLAPVRPDRKKELLTQLCTALNRQALSASGRESICLMHAILGSASRLEAPGTPIEKQVAKIVTARYGSDATKHASTMARDMLESLDSCGLPDELRCTGGIDVDEMAKRMFGGGNPIFPGLSLAAQRFEPDPETTVGPQKAGWIFTTDFAPSKDCESQYAQDFPAGNIVLAPPTVNKIEAWDPGLHSVIREGRVKERQLGVRSLDIVHGWNAKITEMQVPLSSPFAMLMVNDLHPANSVVSYVAHPQGDVQVLAVDVRSGLKIRLSGANFIADTCEVSAQFRPWGTPDDGRLVPGDVAQVASGLNGLQLSVHGDDTQPPDGSDVTEVARDVVVFEWPAALTAPGLYSLHLRFQNTTGQPTTMVHDQNCATTPDFGPARSQVIHFVILPDVAPSATTIRLRQASCHAKNSAIYDNVSTTFSGATVRFAVDPATDQLEAALVEERSGVHSELVFVPPKDWDPGLRAFPDSPPRPLRLDEFSMAQLLAMDLPHGVTNLLVAILVAVIFVIGILMLLMLLVAAIVLIIYLTPAVLAAAAIPVKFTGAIIVAMITGSFGFAGFLGTAWGAVMGPLNDLILATFNAERIGKAEITFGGAELAHLTSGIRFHRAIWAVPRELSLHADGGMVHDFSNIGGNAIIESWRSNAGGGEYWFETEARSS